jgi:hypothetical protein
VVALCADVEVAERECGGAMVEDVVLEIVMGNVAIEVAMLMEAQEVP